MTMLRGAFALVVDFGMVVNMSRVWNIVEMFVSPAEDPR